MIGSPLDQFKLYTLVPIKIGGVDFSFTNSAFFMIMAAFLAVLIPYFVISSTKSLIPSRKWVVLEGFYSFVKGLVEQYVNDLRYFPLILSLFSFLLFANLMGVLPGAFTITSHLSVTLFLALSMYIVVIFFGILKNGFKFFSLFLPKSIPVYLAPLFIPIEIISFVAKPISLSIRLFANMLAGHIMVKIFAGFVVMLLSISQWGSMLSLVPLLVNVALIAFEVIVAGLQAYVFTVLTCLYLHDVLNLH